MSDYISREELKLRIHKKIEDIHKEPDGTLEYADALFANGMYRALDLTEHMPSVDVRENIHGTWEEWKVGKYEGVPICSVCKHGFPLGFNQYNFCPNCGAKMKGGE